MDILDLHIRTGDDSPLVMVNRDVLREVEESRRVIALLLYIIHHLNNQGTDRD